MAFYVICDDDSKHESMTKEQILAAIAQALETGNVENCDTGFVTKIKEQNGGGYVTFWVGTQAQYNALAETSTNCLYIITDDTSTSDTKAAFEAAVKSAEDAAIAAGELVRASMPIDITDKLTFTLNDYSSLGLNSFNVNTSATKFLYSPSTKTVFFNFAFSVQGKFTNGNSFAIKLGGSYLPSRQLQFMQYSVANDSKKSKAILSLTGTPSFMLYALEDMTSFDGKNLTGWYFCDGEGV